MLKYSFYHRKFSFKLEVTFIPMTFLLFLKTKFHPYHKINVLVPMTQLPMPVMMNHYHAGGEGGRKKSRHAKFCFKETSNPS